MPEPTIREQVEQLVDYYANDAAGLMAALSPLLERVEQQMAAMQSTIDVLGDSDEVRGIAAGMADMKAGRVYPLRASFESELRRRVEGLSTDTWADV